ncbi:MAG: hypothetical protein ACXVBE_02575 [Bdellovibrionota bacterium]
MKVFLRRRSALSVLSVLFLVTVLEACGSPTEQIPPGKEADASQPSGNNPITTVPTDPADSSDPVDSPKNPVAQVAALWEKPHPQTGPDWTSYAMGVVRDHGANLLVGTTDMASFCPAYSSLNQDQKISFWVYLVSAVTKYESGFDPTNRYKESTMGTDPVTKQPVYSEGLLQLSYQDQRNYSFCNEFDWNKDKLLAARDPKKTILDPYKNLKCGIQILNKIVGIHHAIAFGSGHYWSTLMTTSSHNQLKGIKALTNQVLFCRK